MTSPAERWPGGGYTTERWRKPITPLARWAPIDLLLAWIDVESNGQNGVVTPLGERGLFQIHPDEQDFLKLSDESFHRLTTDAGHSLRVGVDMALKYAVFAKRFLAEVGSEWHGRDFWKLVKLHHGAFSIPIVMLRAFARTHGRGPLTWRELQTFALDAAAQAVEVIPGDAKTSAKIRALIPSTFANAEKTGERSQLPEINPMDAVQVGDILRSFQLML